MPKQPKTKSKKIGFKSAMIPIVFLTVSLFLAIAVYGQTPHIPLIVATMVAGIVAALHGFSYQELQEAMLEGINLAMGAVLILMVIGTMIGTWILGGIVPTMIYYGLKLLSPAIFLVATLLICSIVSLGTGSSWSTAGTVGIALIIIGNGLGIPVPIVAGAIISGAYFGDKMSPLSDTTNLAPAVAGTDVFTHIWHMIYTTGPSYIISVIIFSLIGLKYSKGEMGTEKIDLILTTLDKTFFIHPVLLLAPVIIIILVIRKVPPLPALFVGSLLGVICALAFQVHAPVMKKGPDTLARNTAALGRNVDLILPDLKERYQSAQTDEQKEKIRGSLENIRKIRNTQQILTGQIKGTGPEAKTTPKARVQKIISSAYNGFESETGNEMVDDLLSRGGLLSMMDTVAIIICALSFGGIMEKTGMLHAISRIILKKVRTTGSLVLSTLLSCTVMNLLAAEQYMAIVIPGRMLRETYQKKGLHPKNLSRCLEDSGTLTSPLIPWNSCGAFMGATLGISPFLYLPYAFLNLLNPLISIFYGYTGITMEKIETQQEDPVAPIPPKE